MARAPCPVRQQARSSSHDPPSSRVMQPLITHASSEALAKKRLDGQTAIPATLQSDRWTAVQSCSQIDLDHSSLERGPAGIILSRRRACVCACVVLFHRSTSLLGACPALLICTTAGRLELLAPASTLYIEPSTMKINRHAGLVCL
jgi:hypothetical protein